MNRQFRRLTHPGRYCGTLTKGTRDDEVLQVYLRSSVKNGKLDCAVSVALEKTRFECT